MIADLCIALVCAAAYDALSTQPGLDRMRAAYQREWARNTARRALGFDHYIHKFTRWHIAARTHITPTTDEDQDHATD